MNDENKGYSKEKANKLIKEHEARAGELERQAGEDRQYETFDRRDSNDLRQEAKKEREKADNLRALKKSWGD